MKFYCKCPSLFICITKDDPPPGRCRRLRPHASQCHPLLGGGWSSGDAASAEPSPPPPYPPSTMHSPMTCAHPAPSSSSPLMAQPAVFVGVVSHHLGSTSPRHLHRLLRFLPRILPSCVLVPSSSPPIPTMTLPPTTPPLMMTTTTTRFPRHQQRRRTRHVVRRLRDWASRRPSVVSPSSSSSSLLTLT